MCLCVCAVQIYGSDHWGLDALIRVEESMDALGCVLVIKHKMKLKKLDCFCVERKREIEREREKERKIAIRVDEAMDVGESTETPKMDI